MNTRAWHTVGAQVFLFKMKIKSSLWKWMIYYDLIRPRSLFFSNWWMENHGLGTEWLPRKWSPSVVSDSSQPRATSCLSLHTHSFWLKHSFPSLSYPVQAAPPWGCPLGSGGDPGPGDEWVGQPYIHILALSASLWPVFWTHLLWARYFVRDSNVTGKLRAPQWQDLFSHSWWTLHPLPRRLSSEHRVWHTRGCPQSAGCHRGGNEGDLGGHAASGPSARLVVAWEGSSQSGFLKLGWSRPVLLPGHYVRHLHAFPVLLGWPAPSRPCLPWELACLQREISAYSPDEKVEIHLLCYVIQLLLVTRGP